MSTIRLDVKVPVRVTQQQMQGYCAAFNLTLQSYSIEGGHSLDVTVAEQVSPETQARSPPPCRSKWPAASSPSETTNSMKRFRVLFAAAVAATLPACSTLPPQSITIASDGRPPLTLTTGKDVRSTAKQAALDVTGWYLRQLINPAK